MKASKLQKKGKGKRVVEEPRAEVVQQNGDTQAVHTHSEAPVEINTASIELEV